MYYRLERVSVLEAVQATETGIASCPKKCKDMVGKKPIQESKVCLSGNSEKYKKINQIPEISKALQGYCSDSKLL